jgi:hypothetical protein
MGKKITVDLDVLKKLPDGVIVDFRKSICDRVGRGIEMDVFVVRFYDREWHEMRYAEFTASDGEYNGDCIMP